jgi:hypothetical protein
MQTNIIMSQLATICYLRSMRKKERFKHQTIIRVLKHSIQELLIKQERQEMHQIKEIGLNHQQELSIVFWLKA